MCAQLFVVGGDSHSNSKEVEFSFIFTGLSASSAFGIWILTDVELDAAMSSQGFDFKQIIFFSVLTNQCRKRNVHI